MIDFDRYHGLRRGPLPLYRRLRDDPPVYHHERLNFRAPSRYAHVLVVHQGGSRGLSIAAWMPAVETIAQIRRALCRETGRHAANPDHSVCRPLAPRFNEGSDQPRTFVIAG